VAFLAPAGPGLARAVLLGAVGAGLAASACCIGPLVLAVLGLGGAGLLVKLEPFRPVLGAVTLGLLGLGFWSSYRKPAAAAPEAEGAACDCEVPRARRLGRLGLWLVTALVLAILIFPNVLAWLG